MIRSSWLRIPAPIRILVEFALVLFCAQWFLSRQPPNWKTLAVDVAEAQGKFHVRRFESVPRPSLPFIEEFSTPRTRTRPARCDLEFFYRTESPIQISGLQVHTAGPLVNDDWLLSHRKHFLELGGLFLTIRHDGLTGAGLAAFRDHPGIESLKLEGEQLNGDDLQALGVLPNCRTLELTANRRSATPPRTEGDTLREPIAAGPSLHDLTVNSFNAGHTT